MDSVIDLTGDDPGNPSIPCPNAMSSDGIDDNDLCLLTDAAEVRALALKASLTSSGTSAWRLPGLEEDHMQEVVDLLRAQPRSEASLSTPPKHKGKALKKPALSPNHSRKSSKNVPNITQLTKSAFKEPRTIRITSDVETSGSPSCAATGSITKRVKRAHQPFKFLQLPPEIRNRVYNLLLTTSEPIEMTRARQTTAKREGWLSFLRNSAPLNALHKNLRHVSAAYNLKTYSVLLILIHAKKC